MPERLRAASVRFVSFTIGSDDTDTATAIKTLGAERRWWQARAGTCGGNDASTASFVRQIDHIVQLVGRAHVGFGLDYVYDMPALSRLAMTHTDKWPKDDGYTTPDIAQVEPERLPQIADALLGLGYSNDDVTGILGGNWLRVARQVWR